MQILNLAQSMSNVILIDAEHAFEVINIQMSGFDTIMEKFMINISAVTGIPNTLLFGRSAEGMNATGEGDANNYISVIKGIQEHYLSE